jgi:16S rRNA (cytosine1402-N4)-methyltransferase
MQINAVPVLEPLRVDDMEFVHKPVMPEECAAGLKIRPSGIYADGTLGGGGHSKIILQHGGAVIGIDRDDDAILQAKTALAGFSDIIFERDNFSNILHILARNNIKQIDGALLDLGVSSYQLDFAGRGFSYRQDGPLDMRMDRRSKLSAFDVVNFYPEKKLTEIFYKYGEERWAKRIAGFIADARKVSPVKTTFELVEIIKKAVPRRARDENVHPARRVFMAVRIETNAELSLLASAVADFVSALAPGGRMCVITFHSLEDRIIKETFRELADPCVCPKDFPHCVCGKKPIVNIITRKPIIPSLEEIKNNARAKSAKLRICEKI